jgi:hypothetical protein
MLSFPEVHPGIHMALCPICRSKRGRDWRESGDCTRPGPNQEPVGTARTTEAAANPVPSQAKAEDGR